MRRGLLLFFCIAALTTAQAQTVAPNILPQALEGIGIDQRLNAQVPPGLSFFDESGKEVTLSDYFGEKPTLLILAYYECPRLCTMVLNGAADALSKSGLKRGTDYQIITVSINPNEGPRLAAAKKASYLLHYGAGDPRAWHFLTGPQKSISALASAVGFHYHYNPQTKDFIHASAIMILTPQGKLSHYFYGISYPPRDLRLALVEASHGRIGNPVDKLLLFCCSIDLTTGKYTASIWKIMRLMGFGFVLVLAGLIFLLNRYEPKHAP